METIEMIYSQRNLGSNKTVFTTNATLPWCCMENKHMYQELYETIQKGIVRCKECYSLLQSAKANKMITNGKCGDGVPSQGN